MAPSSEEGRAGLALVADPPQLLHRSELKESPRSPAEYSRRMTSPAAPAISWFSPFVANAERYQ